MLGTGGDVDTMGTEREPGNLTCLARLGTGGDVDTMGTTGTNLPHETKED